MGGHICNNDPYHRAAIVLSSGNINTVASLSVFGIFIVFAFVNFSVIWLRFKQPNVNRTFMSPFKLKRFPSPCRTRVIDGLNNAISV